MQQRANTQLQRAAAYGFARGRRRCPTHQQRHPRRSSRNRGHRCPWSCRRLLEHHRAHCQPESGAARPPCAEAIASPSLLMREWCRARMTLLTVVGWFPFCCDETGLVQSGTHKVCYYANFWDGNAVLFWVKKLPHACG